MKAILTSTGFDNKNIEAAFISMLSIPCKEAKALFIPTALNTADAKEYIPVFMDDLLNAGIPKENISTYDLDYPFSTANMLEFDVVYFCPGSPEYLLERIIAVKFDICLKAFLEKGGIYLGVSAGSDIAGNNFPSGLRLVDAFIVTHAKAAESTGLINIAASERICITDNQAIIINGDEIRIIE
ncbi:MAG: Type 1 glutamine amidotransferase-like domain-containing protein [Clostridia bacterium]|nr:Type 1 glutamine amidotransferase-like domain-containing protein [Clostridia bacterium]